MEKLWSEVWGLTKDYLAIEGKRLVREKLSLVTLRAILGIRSLVLLQTAFIAVSFIWIASFFAMGIVISLSLVQPELYRNGLYPSALGLGFAAFLVSSILLYWVSRRQTWVRAFGVEVKERKARSDEGRSRPVEAASPIDYAEIARIVDRVVAERLVASEKRAMRFESPISESQSAAVIPPSSVGPYSAPSHLHL